MIIAPVHYLIYIIEHKIKTSEAYVVKQFLHLFASKDTQLEEQSDFLLNMSFYQ